MVRQTTSIFIGIFVAVVIWRAAHPASLAAAGPTENVVPQDTCVVELNLPEGATVSVDGREYGTKRLLTFQGLNPQRTYSSRLIVSFGNGAQVERKLLVSGGQRLQVAVANPETKRPVVVLQTGHSRRPDFIAFSPDGHYLASAPTDQAEILLWDVKSGRKVRQLSGSVNTRACLDFSLDGQRLVSGGSDTVRVWNLTTAKQLRLWHVKSGPRTGLVAQRDWQVNCVAISQDGRYVAAGGYGEIAPGLGNGAALRVWDVDSGAELWNSQGFTDSVNVVAFSPDGRRIVSAPVHPDLTLDKSIRLWDAKSGRALGRFDVPVQQAYSVGFSKTGERVIVGACDTALGFWDLESGQKLDRTDIPSATLKQPGVRFSHFCRVLFSGDGRHALRQVNDTSVSVADIGTGRELRNYEGVVPLALSHDGRLAAYAMPDGVQLWDVEQWREVCRLEANLATDTVMGISPNGEWLVSAKEGNWISGDDHALYLWNVSSGRMFNRLAGHHGFIQRVVFSPDNRMVASASNDQTFRLWDIETGREVWRNVVDTLRVADIGFSPDGRRLITAIHGEDVSLWDIATRKQIRWFDLPGPAAARCVAYSPDGRYVAAGRWSGEIHVWDANSGREVRRFQEDKFVRALTFFPDGKKIASDAIPKRLWDVETGREIRGFFDQNMGSRLAFSPDGRLMASPCLIGSLTAGDATGHYGVLLCDTQSGRVLHQLKGHRYEIGFVAFSQSGHTLVSSNKKEGLRLWDVATGSELARVAFFKSGDLIVTTSEGLFDGPERARNLVGYTIADGLDVVPVDRFFQDFYYPGLLPALLQGERPLPGAKVKLLPPPLVRIVSPSHDTPVDVAQVALVVELSDQGGGIQGPWLVHNGARVPIAGNTQREGDPARHTLTATLVQGENRLEVHAASTDGAWESEPAVLVLRYEKPLDQPEIHVLAVGVSDYRLDAYDLKFAAADANAIAALFDKRGKSLYKSVHVSNLIDAAALKTTIHDTLKAIAARAEPQDTLVVFLAGHGVTLGQRFYFLPHDFSSQAKTVEEDIRQQGLPADVLGDWIGAVPALKRVLIFDTCQSASALSLAGLSRDPFTLRGAMERLSRAQGVFTIVAGETDAYEVKELQHGLLTYTLLAGLRAVDRGPLADKSVTPTNDDRLVDVLGWFSFASDHVPDLTEHYFGKIQQVQTAGHGMSFPILPLDEP